MSGQQLPAVGSVVGLQVNEQENQDGEDLPQQPSQLPKMVIYIYALFLFYVAMLYSITGYSWSKQQLVVLQCKKGWNMLKYILFWTPKKTWCKKKACTQPYSLSIAKLSEALS